jgi:hypothetical protein
LIEAEGEEGNAEEEEDDVVAAMHIEKEDEREGVGEKRNYCCFHAKSTIILCEDSLLGSGLLLSVGDRRGKIPLIAGDRRLK